MAIQRKCHSCFSLTVSFLVILFSISATTTAEDSETPVSENDIHLTADPNFCKNDDSLSKMCRTCGTLPQVMSLPVEECCTDEDAMAMCGQCLDDPASCLHDFLTLEAAMAATSDYDQDDIITEPYDLSSQDVNFPPEPDAIYPDGDEAVLENTKRFGTLYLGKRPLDLHLPRTVPTDVIKRQDKNDPADDFESDVSDVDKRWGTLGLGSRSYGRYSRLYWTPANQIPARNRNTDKRWGTLGIGKRWGSLGIGNGKRWGSLGIGKKWGTLGFGKRWGSLGLGDWKRWASLGLGSRYRVSVGKRWGTLGIGKRYDQDENQPNEDKRWGTLGLGSRIQWGPTLRGKRWGSLGLSGWRKRWGRRGFGKRWGTLGIGKRNEVLTPLDDAQNNMDFINENEEDKRWGTLNIGKRDADLDAAAPEDKRWGSLGIGKRWGSLGGFGGFKRWGYINLGHGNRYSNQLRKLGKRSADGAGSTSQGDQDEISGTEKDGKGHGKNNVLQSRRNKWGLWAMAKKWGSLGIGKKWGTLSFGKKWGSLGIGKKRGENQKMDSLKSSPKEAEKQESADE